MKDTLFINLLGGPGTGKSTLCAEIFAELKKNHVDCEMSLEYAKGVVWEESFKKLDNQIYIFGKQYNLLFRLMGKLDVVITDSPLLNSIIYDKTSNKYLKDLVLFEFKKLNSINYYLTRGTDYEPNGRMQTQEVAIEIDIMYKNLLKDNNIPHREIIVGTDKSVIINEILSYLEINKK